MRFRHHNSEGADAPSGNHPFDRSSVELDAVSFELIARCEAEEIEQMPIEDVRAELTRLGIVPEESIDKILSMIR
jgi:hypothetical protein